jgi:hypothetical protein
LTRAVEQKMFDIMASKLKPLASKPREEHVSLRPTSEQLQFSTMTCPSEKVLRA